MAQAMGRRKPRRGWCAVETHFDEPRGLDFGEMAISDKGSQPTRNGNHAVTLVGPDAMIAVVLDDEAPPLARACAISQGVDVDHERRGVHGSRILWLISGRARFDLGYHRSRGP